MARFVSTTIASGQSVFADSIALKSMILTAGAADATVTLKGAGVTEVILAAKAGTSSVYPSISGGAHFALDQIPGPVTLDLTGTGAFTRVSY